MLSACFCKNIYADLNITDIKGLYTSIKPEYEYWSPIHGIIAVKTDFLRNLYLMEMQEEKRKKEAGETEPSPILNMLRQFFTINPVDKTLRITQSKTSIGSYLTPRLLADFIDYIMKEEIDEKKDTKFAQYLQKNGVKISKTNVISRAVRECRQVVTGEYYALPYIGQAILVSWLVMKVDTKEEIAVFFDRLVKLKSPLVDDEYDKKKFLSDVYDQQEKNVMELVKHMEEKVKDISVLYEYYSRAFFKKDITITEEYTLETMVPRRSFLRAHYEDLVFIGLVKPMGGKISFHEFPSYKSGFKIPFGKFKDTGVFADCVETSLRTFVNELLNTGTSFDYHSLKEQGIVLNPAVEKFYDVHHDFKTMNTRSVHEKWLEIMSHIKGASIEYQHVHAGQRCEIRSTMRNVIRALRYIFSPVSDEVLGIESVPKVITVQYMIDFFSHILDAIFKNNNTRKIHLDRVRVNNGTDIFLKNMLLDKATGTKNTDFFEQIRLYFVDTLSGESFEWVIGTGHAQIYASYEKNAVDMYNDVVDLLYNIYDYNVIDLYSVIVFTDPWIITTKEEYINREFLVLAGTDEALKEEILRTLLDTDFYGTVQDYPFFSYFFPSPQLIFDIEDVYTWKWLVHDMMFKFDITLSLPYMQYLVAVLMKEMDEELPDRMERAYASLKMEIRSIKESDRKELYPFADKWLARAKEKFEKFEKKKKEEEAKKAWIRSIFS